LTLRTTLLGSVGAVIPEFVEAGGPAETGDAPVGAEGVAVVCAKATPERQRKLPTVKNVVILFTELV
jgi:hypothetical protein